MTKELTKMEKKDIIMVNKGKTKRFVFIQPIIKESFKC